MGRSERRSHGVLLVLLIFVLVNEDATQISFLGLDFTMPKGVAKLFSAVAGVLVMALIGGWESIGSGRHSTNADAGRRSTA